MVAHAAVGKWLLFKLLPSMAEQIKSQDEAALDSENLMLKIKLESFHCDLTHSFYLIPSYCYLPSLIHFDTT